MANIDKNLIIDMATLNFRVVFHDDVGLGVPENATSITIVNTDVIADMTVLALPTKKLVDVTWVIGRLNKRKISTGAGSKHKNLFDDLLEALLNKIGIGFVDTIYPTQYGFGILQSNNKTHQRIVGELDILIDKNSIETNISISESSRVEQYTIIRSAKNLKLVFDTIQKLKAE